MVAHAVDISGAARTSKIFGFNHFMWKKTE